MPKLALYLLGTPRIELALGLEQTEVTALRRKTAALLTLDRRLKALADAAGIRIVTL